MRYGTALFGYRKDDVELLVSLLETERTLLRDRIAKLEQGHAPDRRAVRMARSGSGVAMNAGRIRRFWIGCKPHRVRDHIGEISLDCMKLRKRLIELAVNLEEKQKQQQRLTAERRRMQRVRAISGLSDVRTERAIGRSAPTSGQTKGNLPAQVPLQTPGSGKGRLGDMLLERGYITRRQLNEAMEYQERFGGRLGDILASLGFIEEETLQEAVSRQPGKGKLGDMLVSAGLLTSVELEQALAFQRKSGGLLGDILLSLRLVEPEQLYRMIATQNQIGRIGRDLSFDTDVRLPESMARSLQAVVVHQYPNRYLVAVSEPLGPERARELEQWLGMPIEQVLATREEMERFWAELYENEMLHESISKLASEQPHNSAIKTFTKGQIVFFAALTAAFLIALALRGVQAAIVVNIIVQIFYFGMSVFKIAVVMIGSRKEAQYRFSPEHIAEMDEREMPVYTILVPLYKETAVLPQLIGNLERLDYPKSKLDVRLLIEEDDATTKEAIRSLQLPPYYTTLIVPHSLPKTKPKACNFGLIRARGEYVVIYDAEDRPDPDQLKKVLATFRSTEDNVACVQAKLNYFNSEQNLLTRWFTHEYSMWFELLLPGIMRLNVPIPLGGTSNHFKMSVIKQLNAWDPYNVTEDADLGIRLYKAGYRTAIVDSRTWEEANSRTGNWIRQRSRWIKGYMQTWLVHMRNPVQLWRDIGARGFWGFQVMVLATPLLPLLNPIYWAMLVLWYGWQLAIIREFFPGIIYYLSAVEFMIGNFLFVFANIAGVYWVIRDLESKGEFSFSYSLVRYALLTPVYWVMMSIAAAKALGQLLANPFYWEKTTHGLATGHSAAAGSGSPTDA